MSLLSWQPTSNPPEPHPKSPGTLAPVEDESLDLEMLASSLAADYSDTKMLLRVLADRLAGALGDRLTVERDKAFLRKSNQVRSLSVVLGEDELSAAIRDGRLECSFSHRSGGIKIRSERLSLSDWLRRLLSSLQTEAASSQASRQALEAIVIGSRHDG